MNKHSKTALELLAEGIKPNVATLKKTGPFMSLLRLVGEYVIESEIPRLTKEERYEIAKWASVCHIAAAQDDPPMPCPPRPESLKKITFTRGQVIIVENLGRGMFKEGVDHGDIVVALESTYQLRTVPRSSVVGIVEPSYPNLDKMRSVKDAASVLTHFVDWLSENDMTICRHSEQWGGSYEPQQLGMEGLFSKHFEIDCEKIEEERNEVLAVQRMLNVISA